MNLAAAAPPIFLGLNYLRNSAGVIFGTSTPKITVTSGATLADRLVDMDPFSTWNSSSTATQTIDIPIYVGTTVTTKTDIALIALLNTNFNAFTVALSSDGGSNFTDTYTITGNALSDYIIDASAAVKTANFIRIVCTTTFPTNTTKILGTVVVASLLRQMTAVPIYPIARGVDESLKVLTMADGSKNITYLKRSAASYEFYNAGFKFTRMADSELLAMRALRRANPSFIFYPEPGDKTGEMYQSMFTPGSFKSQLSASYKGAGNDLSFNIEEIG